MAERLTPCGANGLPRFSLQGGLDWRVKNTFIDIPGLTLADLKPCRAQSAPPMSSRASTSPDLSPRSTGIGTHAEGSSLPSSPASSWGSGQGDDSLELHTGRSPSSGDAGECPACEEGRQGLHVRGRFLELLCSFLMDAGGAEVEGCEGIGMIEFIGPAQALAVAPLCDDVTLAAWANTHRAVHAAFLADVVWRRLLAERFRPAFACLGPEEPEALVARLQQGDRRRIYAALRKMSAAPFHLEPRSRLLLEIHELREWDRHVKLLIMHRQANHLAGALCDSRAAAQIRALMAPEALELISLQSMIGGGGVQRLLELAGLRWGPSVHADLRQLMEKRLQRRRMWWQRQREYLLQGLEWH